mmetsp:Transcript_74757/g.218992  ORF Transcript_74757/g.218992 Transcript_74757/m.218992 type:complete len:347 (-) Transcript_74757:2-1042(-)
MLGLLCHLLLLPDSLLQDLLRVVVVDVLLLLDGHAPVLRFQDLPSVADLVVIRHAVFVLLHDRRQVRLPLLLLALQLRRLPRGVMSGDRLIDLRLLDLQAARVLALVALADVAHLVRQGGLLVHVPVPLQLGELARLLLPDLHGELAGHGLAHLRPLLLRRSLLALELLHGAGPELLELLLGHLDLVPQGARVAQGELAALLLPEVLRGEVDGGHVALARHPGLHRLELVHHLGLRDPDGRVVHVLDDLDLGRRLPLGHLDGEDVVGHPTGPLPRVEKPGAPRYLVLPLLQDLAHQRRVVAEVGEVRMNRVGLVHAHDGRASGKGQALHGVPHGGGGRDGAARRGA